MIERFRRVDYSNLPVFVALQKRQQWLQQRQSVLAENVANADTPGYKP
ncbi:flagellar basal body protein, partial [Vibrio parahaemolyticus]